MEENSANFGKKIFLVKFWHNFSSTQKFLISGSVLVVFFLLAKPIIFNGDKNTIFDISPQEAANALGPVSFAQCYAGQIAISALVARGDKINSNFADANESLGKLLQKSKPYAQAMISSNSGLDNLIKNNFELIRMGDDAGEIVSNCLGVFEDIYKNRKQRLSERNKNGLNEQQNNLLDSLERQRSAAEGR